jgi:hypothetical protein
VWHGFDAQSIKGLAEDELVVQPALERCGRGHNVQLAIAR